MKFSQDPLISDAIRWPRRLWKRIKKGKYSPRIILLYLLFVDGTYRLEYMNSMYLKQPAFPTDDMYVLGAAVSPDDAAELVAEMTQEYLREENADRKSLSQALLDRFFGGSVSE